MAVDCTRPAPTCFCDTTGSGPAADHGHDLALTELDGPRGIVYLVRAGTAAGAALVAELQLAPAPRSIVRQADLELRYATREMIREMPVRAAQAVGQLDHPRWDDVAERCLTCGNCTAVCPTCFCTDMDDRVGLDGESATRTRVWDTCFSLEYSQLGAEPQRASPKARYRQWLSHKLGTWHDQFGESGCVGCGRCITWCPVGHRPDGRGRGAGTHARGGVDVTASDRRRRSAGSVADPTGSRGDLGRRGDPRGRHAPGSCRSRATPKPFRPAQFGMVGAFGVGEAAISISSPATQTAYHEYTIRRAGTRSRRRSPGCNPATSSGCGARSGNHGTSTSMAATW